MKKTLKKVIPRWVLEQVRAFKKNYVRIHSNFPVSQVYVLNDLNSRIGISNFYSVFEPLKQIDAEAFIEFYDENGKSILKQKKIVPSKASIFLEVKEIFKEKSISSKMGIVSLKLIPKNKRKYDLSMFGNITSHFFMFYYGIDQSSFSHIHPLSVLDPENKPDPCFHSSQQVFINGLTSIKLYQMNPTKLDQTLEYKFTSDKGEVVTKSVYIAKNGVSTVDFNLNEFKHELKQFGFSVSPLPSGNAKPLLMRIFTNGLFSMSHS